MNFPNLCKLPKAACRRVAVTPPPPASRRSGGGGSTAYMRWKLAWWQWDGKEAKEAGEREAEERERGGGKECRRQPSERSLRNRPSPSKQPKQPGKCNQWGRLCELKLFTFVSQRCQTSQTSQRGDCIPTKLVGKLKKTNSLANSLANYLSN